MNFKIEEKENKKKEVGNTKDKTKNNNNKKLVFILETCDKRSENININKYNNNNFASR